ncbi:hypothetical protein J2790_004139 [Paenarthrobacter nicotinovorans]|uniref:hypothetical protein n=1 Tax=Micrococcaceae TaxID=1268 RepID=UPI000876C01A|nr:MULTISPECIES: hypothetical protein [Micrococcaceae]MDR6438964.1 hypothetical protein [Paenarthrobacter nicotinovorans]SCZ66826.1 hypothetical protein SAMN02799638_04483 [Arthrobacter sp. UNCCL28]
MTHSSSTSPTADRTPETADTRGQVPAPDRSSTAVAVGAFSMAAIVGLFALILHTFAQDSPRLGPVYAGWPEAAADSPLPALRWFLSDMTEPLFFASDLAALGLLAGAAVAWLTAKRGRTWAGSIGYGTGLWPWVLASASLSLLLSNLAFGWMLDDGWQPTFVPFVCVAPAMVILYGGGWKTCATGAVLGAATTTPLALLLIPVVSGPLGLPVVVANVLAMSIGSVASFMVARRLPWLGLREPDLPAQQHRPPSSVHRTFRDDAGWGARRVLKDFTETHFFANEIAGAGVILAAAVAFVLNPGLPSYGSQLLPHILFAQALTSGIGVVLWLRWYRDGGWAATYASVVSVAPAAVLAYGGSWSSVVGGAVLGAVLAPPIARVVSARLPAGFHPVIGNTAAMAVSTAVALPLLGLLPH